MDRILRFVISTLLLTSGLAQELTEELQEATGSYVDLRGRQLTKKPVPAPDTRLRTTSLLVLTILADGSTLRSGVRKNQIKRAITWIRKQIDDRGRIALRTHPEWFEDHALGTFAISEAARLSKYRTLDERIVQTGGYLRTHLETEGATVTPEMLFWGRATIESIRMNDPERFARSRRLLPRLIDAVARHAPQTSAPKPKTDLGRSLDLLRLVRFDRSSTSKAQIENLLDAATARASHLATMHPRAVAFYTLAIYQTGGARWKSWQRTLEQSILKRQVNARYWNSPVAELGPIRTTAWHMLSLQCYYRYVKTVLVQ